MRVSESKPVADMNNITVPMQLHRKINQTSNQNKTEQIKAKMNVESKGHFALKVFRDESMILRDKSIDGLLLQHPQCIKSSPE